MSSRMILKQLMVVAAISAAVMAAEEPSGDVKELQVQSDLIPALVKASAGIFQGRGKKGGYQGMMMMGATMMAMGMAALAALAGKAAAASMAALLLAAASLLKKGHSEVGGPAAAYEVISHHGRRYLQAAEGYSGYGTDRASD